MFKELTTTSRYYHNYYVQRDVRVPEPTERPRHDLRHVIGQGLIHLGERLARVEEPAHFDEAA